MKHRHPPIVGSWSVVEIDGAETQEASRPEIVFASDGRLSGAGGVNRLMGSYGRDRDALELGRLASTRMVGPPEAMDQEARLLAILEGHLTVTSHGERDLLLTSAAHKLRLAPVTNNRPGGSAR